MIELFAYLDEHFDFYNGDSIVLTGESSGGLGTYFYSNYLFERTKKAKMYAIPDSGLFLVDFYSPFAGAQTIRLVTSSLVKLLNPNSKGFPIPECI